LDNHFVSRDLILMGNILKKIQEKLLKTNKIYNTVRRFKSYCVPTS